MKTGEACEGIALKYAEECAVFDAVTDVRTVAVVIDGRGQRRVLLRQRADVRRDGAGRLALFIDSLRAAHGIVQGEFPHQRCCGIVTFDGEQLGSGRAKRANLFTQKRAVLYVAQQKRSVRAEDERAFISVIKQAACAAAQRFRHVDALGRGVHQMFALTVSAI